MLTRGQVSLGILAGGQGRRLGGADKAFVEFQGKPLLSRTLAALGAGFAEVLVSYNGSDPRMSGYALRVAPDLRAGFPGPLAGLEALLHAATREWLLTVPVDLREIPEGLPEILLRSIETEGRGLAVRDADGLQPLVALWPVREGLAAVSAALNADHRAVNQLQQSMRFGVLRTSGLAIR